MDFCCVDPREILAGASERTRYRLRNLYAPDRARCRFRNFYGGSLTGAERIGRGACCHDLTLRAVGIQAQRETDDEYLQVLNHTPKSLR